MTRPNHVKRLEALLATSGVAKRTALAPGCWDGLTALLIARAGFDLAFLTGAGLSMSRLGRLDLGLVTATEVSDAVSAVRDRVDLPLIVDADTGFGGELNLQRTVRMLERAGASAVQIEDQTFPKRCGHMVGKSVVDPRAALDRIKAALDARDHLLVVARTDSLALDGMEAALARAHAFRDAGADLIFIEGLSSTKEIEQVGSAFGDGTPLVHNMVNAAGKAGEISKALMKSGFSVALHPLLILQALAAAAPPLLERLRIGTGLPDDLPTLHELNELIEYDK